MSAEPKRVGELLIERGLISEQQLALALEEQARTPGETIGQVLLRLGSVEAAQLALVLDQKGKRRRLEDILRAQFRIDPKRVGAAQEVARQRRVPFEDALVALRVVSDRQLAEAIAIQHDLVFVALDPKELDRGLARYLNPTFAHRHRIVPYLKNGDTLTLAMATPLRLHELRDLEQSLRLRVKGVIAPIGEIRAALKTLYNLDKTETPPPEADEPRFVEEEQSSITTLLSAELDADSEAEEEADARRVTEKDSLIVKLLNRIILDAQMSGASDIHIEPSPGRGDVMVRLRVDGRCKLHSRIPYRYKFALASRVKILAGLDIAERRRPQDGKIHFRPGNVELRVATMPTSGKAEDVVIRLLSTGRPLDLDKLGMSPRNVRVFDQAIQTPYGLILVCGPTGSGKTTTLHSAIARLNSPEVKIWTAEDPVEVTQEGLRQVQVNPRIGLTFATALRSFMRLDPDIILVGEIRDHETATTALEASLTGHLVLSTLHTNSAPETVTRLVEMEMDPYILADALVCVAAQRLVRVLCECKEQTPATEQEIEELVAGCGLEGGSTNSLLDGLSLGRPRGCVRCGGTGYRGRTGIHEVMEITDEIRALVKRKSDAISLRDVATGQGMVTLRQDGLLKVMQGVTDLHEVHRVCVR